MHAFLSFTDFFQNQFFEKLFQEYNQGVKSFDPDQARHFVGLDLGPNCLQKLSADDTSWQNVDDFGDVFFRLVKFRWLLSLLDVR